MKGFLRRKAGRVISAAISVAMIISAMGISAGAATTTTEYSKINVGDSIGAYSQISSNGFNVYQCVATRSKITRTSAGGGTFSIVSNGTDENFALSQSAFAEGSAWLDGDASTTGYIGLERCYYIDLGEAKDIDKLVIKNYGGAQIYGFTNTEPTESLITADEWLRVNNSNTKKLNEYDVAYTAASGDDYAYVTLTKKDSASTNYRYLIVDSNGSNTNLGELELYTKSDAGVYQIVATRSSITRTTAGGGTFSIVPKTEGFELTRSAYSEGSAWIDGDASTTGYIGLERCYYIDLGEAKDIDKVVITNYGGAQIYGFTNTAPTDTLVTADEWLRVNNGNNKNLNIYDVAYTAASGSDYAYVTLTKKANAEDAAYRYVIVDSNGSNTNLGEIELYSSVSTTTYEVTANNGASVDKAEGLSAGDTVTITTPDNMVEGSLRVYNKAYATTDGKSIVTVSGNQFTMPESDVEVTCLTDDGTTTVFGYVSNGYYARADHDMNVTFDVTVPDGKKLTSAKLYIPYKTHNYNRSEMYLKSGATVIKQLEDADRTMNQYDVQDVDVTAYTVNGTNTFTVTNSHSAGIDYYSPEAAPKAQYIPRLVLTFEDDNSAVTFAEEVQFDANATETTGTLRFKSAIAQKNFTAQSYGFKFVNFAGDNDAIANYPSYTGDVTGTVTQAFTGDINVNDVFYHDITDIPKEVQGVAVTGVGFYAVPYVYGENGEFYYGTPFTFEGAFDWAADIITETK